jgi:hypothetical protein
MKDFDRMREVLGSGASAPEPAGEWGGLPRQPGVTAGAHSHASSHWRYHAFALAAGLLLGLSVWLAASLWRQTTAVPVAATPVSSPINASDVRINTLAFAEVADVFENRPSWMLVSNGDSSIGLADAPVSRSAELLVLRLTMLHNGKTASSADLVIIAGQNAHVTLPLAQGRLADYRVSTSALDPSRLNLWA